MTIEVDEEWSDLLATALAIFMLETPQDEQELMCRLYRDIGDEGTRESMSEPGQDPRLVEAFIIVLGEQC